MKHTLLTLSFLILTMGLLTLSFQQAGACKVDDALKTGQVCPNVSKAANKPCSKRTAVKKVKRSTPEPIASDIDIPISPISRFILLQ
ncbi:MAG: hypothetical protein ABIN01_03150 [Ferruginibacter sp.]